MKRHLIFVMLSILALPLCGSLPARGQGRFHPAAQMNRAERRQQRAAARMERRQMPAKWMSRLQQMTPAEQERFLENNRRFQGLPAWRQEEIRARLKQWNSLTPEQKQTLIRRAQILERMSPEERREIRQVILPAWQQLPPDRRQVLKEKLLQLRGLNDSEREKRLKDPAFEQGLSPQERNLLKELSKLRVGPGAGND
ncbi:MAG: DUF3106 domain-containing protein [Acidobacteriota bacterium]|nr:DUF3106 domain-containing protein [Acidobacteriota bacterium]